MNETTFDKTQAIWDEEHVKILLSEPESLLVDEPWSSWVEKQGGLNAVRETLQNLALSEKHCLTLNAILGQPGASLQRYALLLHISVATFVRYRAALVKALVAVLNHPTKEKHLLRDAEFSVPNNLPQRRLRLIGREKELEALQHLLRQENVGLLTITGPGGIGKTRLALQIAANVLSEFDDGAFFIPLSSITNPDLVVPTIIKTLGLSSAEGISAFSLLKSYLQDKHILLVLDNFEQIVSAAPLLGELLEAAPELKILVTSRAVLHIYGEHEFNIQPLLIPDLNHLPPLPELAHLPAMALFLDRARAVKADLDLTPENALPLAEICVRLDGIPLALELAAARVKLFSPQALLRELNREFSILAYKSVDHEPRHQTLRNAIAWSYQLLNVEERALFAQLGSFMGGCTLDAVEAVCVFEKGSGESTLEYLSSLVDKSMLWHESRPNGEPRFNLLETLREYALEQLSLSGQIESVYRRHMAYFLQLVEMIEPGAREPNLPAWMNRLEEEHDNFRAALQRALEFGEDDIALRIAGAVWRFWQIHGHIEEGAKWMQVILERTTVQESVARTKALWGAGWLGMVLGTLEQARTYFEEGAGLSRRLGNQRYLGLSLHGIGAVARAQGDFTHSRTAFEESLPLFQALKNTEDVAWTFEHLGATALDQGEFEQAAAYIQQGLTIFRELGQQWPCAEALTFLGHAALQQACYNRARQHYEEARAIYEALDDRSNIAALNSYIGAALFGLGNCEQAVGLYKENLITLHSLNNYWGVVWGVERLADAAEHSGQLMDAARLGGAASTLQRITGVLWHPGFHSQYHERRFAALKAALGEAEWERLWEEGRAMDIDGAVSCALGL
jgi:predicted ATPase